MSNTTEHPNKTPQLLDNTEIYTKELQKKYAEAEHKIAEAREAEAKDKIAEARIAEAMAREIQVKVETEDILLRESAHPIFVKHKEK